MSKTISLYVGQKLWISVVGNNSTLFFQIENLETTNEVDLSYHSNGVILHALFMGK